MSWSEATSVPIVIAAATAAIGIGVNAIAAVSKRFADSAERRRLGYENAVQTLIAWTEYPYRIRRRTSDEALVLQGLAERGHDLQEQIVRHRTWMRTDNAKIAYSFEIVLGLIRPKIHTMCSAAWNAEPIRKGNEMMVGPLGPNGFDDIITPFLDLLGTRFGWRRIQWNKRWKLHALVGNISGSRSGGQPTLPP